MTGTEGPSRPVRESVIPQGRTAGPDRLVKRRPDAPGESREILATQIAGWPLRPDTGSKQGFVRVDVPDPGKDLLIEKDRLDRPPAGLQPLTKAFPIDPGGLGSKPPQNPLVAILRAREEVNPSEASRVDELHPNGRTIGITGDRPHDMPVRWNRSSTSHLADFDAARHSEANDQAVIPLEPDDQLLPAPIDASNAPAHTELVAGDRASPTTGGVTNHISPVDAGPLDRAVENRYRQLATDGFYFREFRHRASAMADRLEPVGGRLYSGRRRIRPPEARESVPARCHVRFEPTPSSESR